MRERKKGRAGDRCIKREHLEESVGLRDGNLEKARERNCAQRPEVNHMRGEKSA